MINRTIQDLITGKLFKNKAVILTGPRQVGKTTLVKNIADLSDERTMYLNCDEPDIQSILERPTSTELRNLFGRRKIIIIDEAQRINNIGITAKLITDEIPEAQLIITGSSAFDIGNKINEPLTGRKFSFSLFPLSVAEMVKHKSGMEERRLLENRIIYGYYPDIVTNPGEERERLLELSTSYLFKDILSLGIIKKPQILDKLIRALALQIGSEVSLNELSRLLGIDKNTVANYIDLLEKVFVIFSLNSLSSNQRNELKKSRKIYFWDNGIRNSVINNFNSLSLRNDVGSLWENFVIAERMKYIHNLGEYRKFYFWRTYQKQEVDFIEEWNGKMYAYEIKWKASGKRNQKRQFQQHYPDSAFTVINRDNFFDFVV